MTQPGKGVVGIGSDGKAKCNGSKLDRSEIDDGRFDVGEVDNEIEKKGQKTSKSKKASKSKKTLGLNFLILKVRIAFTKLRQIFVKALILHHLDSEYHIWVETDIPGYTIGGVFS